MTVPLRKSTLRNPLIAGDHSITLNYEYDDTTQYTVAYWRDGVTARMLRQLTTTKDDRRRVAGPQDVVLENVDILNFSYGVDTMLPEMRMEWSTIGKLIQQKSEARRIVAVRVQLTARPEPVNPDVQVMVSPRTLESTVAVRNLA